MLGVLVQFVEYTLRCCLLLFDEVLRYSNRIRFKDWGCAIFAWERFPIKNLPIDSLLTPIVESTHLNTNMCKFKPSRKDESTAQSADSSKACRKPRAFKCCAIWPVWFQVAYVCRVCLAEQFQLLQKNLEEMIPAAKKAFLQQFYAQVI